MCQALDWILAQGCLNGNGMLLRWFVGVHYDFLSSKTKLGIRAHCVSQFVVEVDLFWTLLWLKGEKEVNQYLEFKFLKLHIYLQTSFKGLLYHQATMKNRCSYLNESLSLYVCSCSALLGTRHQSVTCILESLSIFLALLRLLYPLPHRT